MNQPIFCRHVVVAIPASNTNVGYVETEILLAVRLTPLPLCRKSQQEASCRSALDIALGECGRIREASVVEAIIAVQVERLQREYVWRQVYPILSAFLTPSLEVVGRMIDELKAKAFAVGQQIQLVVAVSPHQFGRIERDADRNPHVVHGQTECGFVVCFKLRLERHIVSDCLCPNLCSRDIGPAYDCESGGWAHHVGCVHISIPVSGRQHAVDESYPCETIFGTNLCVDPACEKNAQCNEYLGR